MNREVRASSYYWQFLKMFGRECYRTWRTELLVGFLILVAVYIISGRDKDSFTVFVIGAEATLGIFVLFVAGHLIRTPFVLFRDRLHVSEGGLPEIADGYAVFGIAILLSIASASIWWVFHRPIPVTISASKIPPPVIILQTAEGGHATKPTSPRAGPVRPGIQSQPQTFQQPPVQAPQSASVTLEDRVLNDAQALDGENRQHLIAFLYEMNARLNEQEKLMREGEVEYNSLQHEKGSLLSTAKKHAEKLEKLTLQAQQNVTDFLTWREKNEFFRDQMEYVFGENPDNGGTNILPNTSSDAAHDLNAWAQTVKIDNADAEAMLDRPIGNLGKGVNEFGRWVSESRGRLRKLEDVTSRR
jgi:hypothetical protein